MDKIPHPTDRIPTAHSASGQRGRGDRDSTRSWRSDFAEGASQRDQERILPHHELDALVAVRPAGHHRAVRVWRHRCVQQRAGGSDGNPVRGRWLDRPDPTEPFLHPGSVAGRWHGRAEALFLRPCAGRRSVRQRAFRARHQDGRPLQHPPHPRRDRLSAQRSEILFDRRYLRRLGHCLCAG
jgi:hypothetical protein